MATFVHLAPDSRTALMCRNGISRMSFDRRITSPVKSAVESVN